MKKVKQGKSSVRIKQLLIIISLFLTEINGREFTVSIRSSLGKVTGVPLLTEDTERSVGY